VRARVVRREGWWSGIRLWSRSVLMQIAEKFHHCLIDLVLIFAR
jgi:hypothetical protein